MNETGSDSSSMDNMLELLLAGGMDIVRAMRLLVPPAWQNNPDMDPELRAFFDFNSMHMEPWDGPAGIVMSDGRYAACNLDRNGLRPARYVITKDKLITCASEVGIWDYQPDEVVEKGRVGPGELMVIDTRGGRILHSAETDDDLKSRHPYKEWMEKTSAAWCRLKIYRTKTSAAASWMTTRSPASRNSLTTAQKSWTPSCVYWVKTARSGRFNGRRYPVCRALQPAAYHLRLLPSAVRAGD